MLLFSVASLCHCLYYGIILLISVASLCNLFVLLDNATVFWCQFMQFVCIVDHIKIFLRSTFFYAIAPVAHYVQWHDFCYCFCVAGLCNLVMLLIYAIACRSILPFSVANLYYLFILRYYTTVFCCSLYYLFILRNYATSLLLISSLVILMII